MKHFLFFLSRAKSPNRVPLKPLKSIHFNPLTHLFSMHSPPLHRYGIALFLCSLFFFSPQSWAGLFFLPHYMPEGQKAVGMEPQWLLSEGAALDFQLRAGQGISELVNIGALVGTGSGQNRFRVGGSATFDFYPDDGGQPGLGLALQGVFTRTIGGAMWSFSATPYLHKTFSAPHMIPIEPFLAFPLEQQIFSSNGPSRFQASFVVGSFFHYGEHWSSVVELGIGITQVMTVFSGGLIYYY